MSKLVTICYRRYEEINKECNFLNITEDERNELEKMINSCKEFDQRIEINLFKAPFLEQIEIDHRIRKDIPINEIFKGGKAFLPEELCDGYKDKKICYCWISIRQKLPSFMNYTIFSIRLI